MNPVHRVVDQVAEPLVQHRRLRAGEARNEALAALGEMGLSAAHGDLFPHQLSGGQVQRVLLAMATILDPAVLVLDEPTAALDVMSKGLMAEVVRNLRDRGKAILLITHDLDLARSLADQVLILYLGQIMETMPALDLLVRPCHPYTLALGRSYPGMGTLRDLGGIRGETHGRRLDLKQWQARAGGIVPPYQPPIRERALETGRIEFEEGCLFRHRCTQSIDECGRRAVSLVSAGRHQVRCVLDGIAELLRLEKVEKRYGRIHALASTDLALRAGELFCLLGETGSGKTTLAMIAAGVVTMDRGTRFFAGRNMDAWSKEDYRSLAREIGVVYQNPAEAVSHRLKVFDIVAEPLRVQHRRRDSAEVRTRVMEVLSDVRLSTGPEILDRYPHELNMGAVQRVYIARALVTGPRFVVADEPTSALDPGVQAKVIKTLLDLQIEKGLTLLFVTHDVGLARKIADRVGVMLAGRVVEMGLAAEVMQRPRHPYTRLLMEGARHSPGFHRRTHETKRLSAERGGCVFADRCGWATDGCTLESPPLLNVNTSDHWVSCFRMDGLKSSDHVWKPETDEEFSRRSKNKSAGCSL